MSETDDPYSEAFIVRHNSSPGAILAIFIPLFLLFGAIPCAMLQPQVREFFEQATDRDYLIVFGVFAAMFGLIAVEFVLTVFRFASGRPAIRISQGGVEGLHAHAFRRFAWDEIGEVYIQHGRVVISRKPKSLFEKFTHGFAPLGSRYRHEVSIMASLSQIDKTDAEIAYALHRFAPPDAPFADPAWTMDRLNFFAMKKRSA